MSHRTSPGGAADHYVAGPAPHGWFQALLTALAALVVMGVVAAAGLWAAGAHTLPGAAFPGWSRPSC